MNADSKDTTNNVVPLFNRGINRKSGDIYDCPMCGNKIDVLVDGPFRACVIGYAKRGRVHLHYQEPLRRLSQRLHPLRNLRKPFDNTLPGVVKRFPARDLIGNRKRATG